jgi:hypothetical protein
MPEICRFLGIIIAMYHRDHAPPHIHVLYGEYQAKIGIGDGVLIEGKLPRRVLGLVRKWRRLHEKELAHNWELAQARETLQKIDPLD